MNGNLHIETDKSKVIEGDFLDIKWDCTGTPDMVSLVVELGGKREIYPVADSGTKRVMVTYKTKGVGKISLVATFSGKKYSKETEVVIKKAKSSNRGAYGSDNRGNGVTFKTKLAVWRDKLNAKWSFFKAQLYYWWLSQKRWQKIILMILLILWIGMIINLMRPQQVPIKPHSESSQTSTSISV